MADTPLLPTTNTSDRSIDDRPAPVQEVNGPEAHPQRRRLRVAVVVAIVAIGAAALAAVIVATNSDGDSAEGEPISVRAVSAEQRNLIDSSTLDGVLGYAQSVSVVSASSGTITSLSDDGDLIERNSHVAHLDARPVVAFYGDVPMYRDLGEGMEGEDVLQVEQNLASLGYHAETDEAGEPVDTGFTVDGVFDPATTAAVRRWQADQEVAEDGIVRRRDIVFTPGPSVVATVSTETGAQVQQGAPLLTLVVESGQRGVYSEHAGEVELVALSGPVRSGDVLYVVDDTPIVGLVTEHAIERDLGPGTTDGTDVELVERMLADAGFGDDLEVDETFDDATAEAIEDWKDDLAANYDGVVVDSTLRRSEIIVLEPGATVESTSELPDPTPQGSELFTYTARDTGRVVRTDVTVADQEVLSIGTRLDVEFPDGQVVAGAVSHVSTASTTDPTDPTAEPQLDVEIVLDSVPDNAERLTELDVEILVVDRLAAGATVVPASALVATADGGFAVEVVSGATTSFVAVTPGLFADGFVEVDGIEPGTTVVVPS